MKKRNSPIFLLIVPVLFCVLLSHRELRAQQQIEPKYISISEGLSSPTVNSVLQDSYGLIWVGTPNGVQKYDGYRFETFKNIPGKPNRLQYNRVWGLLEDAEHNIWVGANEGIARYDRLKNQFVNYSLSNLVVPGGALTFRFFQDSQKRLWAGTQNLEVLKYEPTSDEWKLAKYEIPNVDQSSHNGVSLGMTEDSKGDVWIGSVSHGLMRLAKNENAFKPIPMEQLGGINFVTTGNSITYLRAGAANTLWITTRNGVYRYNTVTATMNMLREYRDAQVEIWNNWNCILPDP